MQNKIIILTLLVLTASGCTQSNNPTKGEGLVLQKFAIADSKLNPNQNTTVEATFINYRSGESSLDSKDIEIFNTGALEVKNKECQPEKIESGKSDLNPKMKCTWNANAPGEDYLSGFESKSLSLSLKYSYDATLKMKDPLSLTFKQKNKINSRKSVEKKVSDRNIAITLNTENPLPINEKQKFSVEIKKTEASRILGKISLNLTPRGLFTCNPVGEFIEGETTINCKIQSSITGERKIYANGKYRNQRIVNIQARLTE